MGKLAKDDGDDNGKIKLSRGLVDGDGCRDDNGSELCITEKMKRVTGNTLMMQY